MADEQPNRRPRGHRRGGFRNDQPDREDRTDAPKGKFIRKEDRGDARGEGRDGRRGRGGRRFEKRRDDRDLDRELRDYWITQRGGDKNEGSCRGMQT